METMRPTPVFAASSIANIGISSSYGQRVLSRNVLGVLLADTLDSDVGVLVYEAKTLMERGEAAERPGKRRRWDHQASVQMLSKEFVTSLRVIALCAR
jgi:hypothetical protein